MIRRTYSVKLVVLTALNPRRQHVAALEGAIATGEIVLAADADTFAKGSGPVRISGSLLTLSTSKGLPIALPSTWPRTFSDTEATMQLGIIRFTIDNANLAGEVVGRFEGNGLIEAAAQLDVRQQLVESRVDAITITGKGALKTETGEPGVVVVNPDPATPIAIARQHFGVGCQYHWPELDADAFVRGARDAGATMVHNEIMALVTTGDLAKQQVAQIKRLVPWAAACRKYGLLLFVSTNSNDVLNFQMTEAIAKARIDTLRDVLGTDRVLFQAMSEDDNGAYAKGNKRWPGVRTYSRSYAASVWPHAQLVDYLPANTGAAFREIHGGASGSTWNTIYVTDNNTELTDKISADRMVAIGTSHLKAGRSFVAYGFNKTPEFATWKRIAAALNGGVVVDAVDAINPELPRGFKKGVALKSLASMKVVPAMRSASIGPRDLRVSYDGRPFGDAANFGLAWQESGAWYWCPFEWCLNGDTSQNWVANLVPVLGNKDKPGICKEGKNGPAHYPKSGTSCFAFLLDEHNTARTNIVPAGSVP